MIRRYSSHSADRRGSGILASIGVLAVVMAMAFAAASTSHVTWNSADLATSDTRMHQAIREAALLLDSSAESLRQWQPGQEVVLIPSSGNPSDIIIKLVSLEQANSARLPSALQYSEGDFVAVLRGKRADSRGPERDAQFLFTARQGRRSPILLSERRM